MDADRINRAIQEKQLEEDLTGEFERTLSDRVRRFLEVKPQGFSANQPFAPVSMECAKLYRDEHFYGCISLSQAVAEAVVNYLCRRYSWKPAKSFEVNVQNLSKRTKLPAELFKHLLMIWERRDDFHHLNPSIPTDRRALATLAREKARLLALIYG